MNFSLSFDDAVHPRISELALYCAELSGEGTLPRRSLFRPKRVAPVITYLFLMDVLHEEGDYRFSLFGSNMAILYGADLTGKRLSEFGDASKRAELRETYDHVVTSGKPLYIRGRYEWPEMAIGIERLLVPMTDDTGQVTSILGLAIPNVSQDALLFFAGHGAARLVIDEVMSLQ
jgi:hypothetical protein